MTDYATTVKALHSNRQFVIYNNDYEQLTMLDGDSKPTKKSLDDAWPDVQAKTAQAATDAAAARASGLAKLADLGLTADEITALVG